jgi:DNA (cytosine-5)-methyltransferase 1
MDYFDFFSGCGGTSEGMRQAGMAVRLGIDWDTDAKSTYKVNFTKAKFISKDIRRLRVNDLAPFIPRKRRRPIVFGACAPCQPFSRQNLHRKGDDGRRTLLREFHRFVRAYKPEYLFVENVPELHAEDNLKGPFAEFLELLDSLKYSYAYKIVMAYHYGVPQSRRRLILIASRLGAIDFPAETRGPNARNKKLPTVWESISKLPRLKAGEAHPEIPNHRAASLSPLNLKRIAAILPDGQSFRRRFRCPGAWSWEYCSRLEGKLFSLLAGFLRFSAIADKIEFSLYSARRRSVVSGSCCSCPEEGDDRFCWIGDIEQIVFEGYVN